MCPLFFNRHVIKHLLGRAVNWTDLAFYDPVLFESLRQLIHDAETSKTPAVMFETLQLNYCIQIPAEEVRGSRVVALWLTSSALASAAVVAPLAIQQYLIAQLDIECFWVKGCLTPDVTWLCCLIDRAVVRWTWCPTAARLTSTAAASMTTCVATPSIA